MIADIAASVVMGQPIPASNELFDKLYDVSAAEGTALENKLIAYGPDRLSQEIKLTFSVIRQIVEACSEETNFLRTTVRPGSGGRYPIKAPFYAIFMAFYDLVVRQQRSPDSPQSILGAIHRLAPKLHTGAHYETTENRVHNINLTKGLIQDHFVAKVPPVLGHGPSLYIDFENALRRSRIESTRYEFKQGILRLDGSRSLDQGLLRQLLETSCGMANLGPDSEGHIFIGVADKASDADKIASVDGVSPKQISGHYVVGIDREAHVLGLTLDEYVQKVVAVFQSADLSEPLKTQILSGFDTVMVSELTVLTILIPRQKKVSFVGGKAFYRKSPNSTVEIIGEELVSVAKLFPA
jgi:hypothetical protein